MTSKVDRADALKILHSEMLADLKGTLILLCRIISVECPTNFEFGATFSTVVYALNWFRFLLDLICYVHQ